MPLGKGTEDSLNLGSRAVRAIVYRLTFAIGSPLCTVLSVHCKMIMYSGSKGAMEGVNHKQGYCSNGSAVLLKIHTLDHRGDIIAPWPQPANIFIKGKTLNVTQFLELKMMVAHTQMVASIL